MSIFHIELKKIDLTILEELKENKVIENKFMDYKGDITYTFFGEDNKSKIDVLKDVVSFANSGGGDIIYGISDNKGVPTKITGIDVRKIDSFKRKAESLMASHIEPRISKYEFSNPILLEDDKEKAILILRIYPSFITPHFVSHSDEMRFWYRTNSGNAIMDLQQVKSSFGYSQTLETKVKSFLMDRISMIQSDETPYPLRDKAKAVIHFIPIYNFFENKDTFDLNKIQMEPNVIQSEIFYTGGGNYQYNIDGFVAGGMNDNTSYYSYVQYFRNGTIELVSDHFVRSKKNLHLNELTSKEFENYDGAILIKNFEKELRNSILPSFLQLMKNHNCSVPIWIQVTLVNVKGFKPFIENPRNLYYSRKNDIVKREIIQLPLIIVDDYEEKLFDKLLPLFNFLWNLAGYEKTNSFDVEGNFIK